MYQRLVIVLLLSAAPLASAESGLTDTMKNGGAAPVSSPPSTDELVESEEPGFSLQEMIALEKNFDHTWKQMVASLMRGDSSGALRYIIEERRSRYEQEFADLIRSRSASDLERMFGDSLLHCFVPGDDWETVRKDWARSTYRSYWHRRVVTCEIVRTEQGTKYSYEIQFTKSRDDAWLISGF